MKRKAAVVALLCAMAMVFSIGVAQATVFTCSVQGVGITNSGYYYVTATDLGAPSQFSARNFLLAGPGVNASFANQFYATALTALSKGGNVQIDIPDITQWSITAMVVSQ